MLKMFLSSFLFWIMCMRYRHTIKGESTAHCDFLTSRPSSFTAAKVGSTALVWTV